MGVDARMFVTFDTELQGVALRAHLHDAGRRMASVVGHGAFWHDDGGCLQLADDEDYDAPKTERTCAKVRVCGRYYGPGYERGNLFSYVAVAEWLELNFRGCTVYYGGDSGEELAPFGIPERAHLIAHWASEHGNDYRENVSTWEPGPQPAPFHPVCKIYGRPLIRTGWGGDFASFYSPATGEVQTWRDGAWLDEEANKQAWWLPKGGPMTREQWEASKNNPANA